MDFQNSNIVFVHLLLNHCSFIKKKDILVIWSVTYNLLISGISLQCVWRNKTSHHTYTRTHRHTKTMTFGPLVRFCRSWTGPQRRRLRSPSWQALPENTNICNKSIHQIHTKTFSQMHIHWLKFHNFSYMHG